MINLKKLRLERNLSQQKLANNFGITQQAIFNYENGISEPDIYMLKQFADFFHTSVDYIIGYTDNPLPYCDETASPETKSTSNELHHLFLYQQLTPQIQTHIDAIMEELVPEDSSMNHPVETPAGNNTK